MGSNEINPIYKIGSKKVKRIILSALFRIRRNIFSSELNLKSLYFYLKIYFVNRPTMNPCLALRPNSGVYDVVFSRIKVLSEVFRMVKRGK